VLHPVEERKESARSCDSRGKRGIGGGIGQIPKRSRQDWPDEARSEGRGGKKRKKGGIS